MISHHHKVIFIHIPKTGGQSVEHLFLDDLGLSWEERAPLLLRPNIDPNLGPTRMAHLYADEYVSRGHVTPAQWDSYFKFAVVRNPYDRIISEYLYRFQKTSSWRTPGPKKFLRRKYETDFSDTARHMQTQLRYVSDAEGNIIVDKVIRFEEMGAETENLTPKIFGETRKLPHRNKTKAPASSDRKAELRKVMAPLITEMYKVDFETFGYPVET